MITVVGMGRKAGDLTAEGREVISKADVVVVKSAKTHVAAVVESLGKEFVSCDDLYEISPDFDALNVAVSERLLSLPKSKKVAFCVYGDGFSDSTVQSLQGSVDFKFVAGVSEGAALLERCPEGYAVFDATAFLALPRVYGNAFLIKGICDKFIASEVKLRLLQLFPYDLQISFYGGKLTQIPLEDLDKMKYDYRTAIYVSALPLTSKKVYQYGDVMEIMRVLRGRNGCPWDREQTRESLRKNVIEEAYELVAAIDSGDLSAIEEEVGDVLMQVAFHVLLGEENGEFTESDVMTALCDKLITRHPHVFGDRHADDATSALKNWDEVKQKQHKIANLSENLSDVPVGMSALMRAQKVQSRAAKGGYDFTNVSQARDKLLEEIAELFSATEENLAEEAGDLLFAAVNVVRLLGADAETALVSGTEKFIRRVKSCEKLLNGKSLKELSQQQFDELWEKVKSDGN